MTAPAIYSTSNKEGVDINSVFYLDTQTLWYPTAPFNVGTDAFGTDGSGWVYVTSTQSLSAGSVVIVSEAPNSWSVAAIGGSAVAAPICNFVGVVGGSTGTMSVSAASGTQTASYFWIQRTGNCPNVRCLANTTANAILHSSATTAGVVTSTSGGSGTTFQLYDIYISQAAGSAAGPNTAVLNWTKAGQAP